MSNCKSCKGTGRQPGYEWMYCIDCGRKGIEKLPEMKQVKYYNGKPIESLTKDELIEAVTLLSNLLIKAQEGAITDIRRILGNDVEECDCLKDGHN